MIRRRTMTDPHPGERGFALLAVMLVLALLGVVAVEFAFSMRLEASMVRSYKEAVLASHLAEAGVQQAIREILSDAQIQALAEDGQLSFYRTVTGQTTPVALPRLKRTRVALGAGEFSYKITDEESRINVNLATPDRIDKLLLALGVDKQERDVINDSLQDWKDPNDEHRANGAESDDYYLKLPVPYRARNALLQDVAELVQIRGVTPEIYWGKADRPGLAEYATVWSRNIVNMNSAPPVVLRALGLSDAEISDIEQARRTTPYVFVPPRFSAGRGLGVGTQTFRIEAEGLVAGEPRARVIAVVQRRAQPVVGGFLRSAVPAGAGGVAIVSWRVPEQRGAN
jgi:general secretion pathway protein K